MNIPKYKIKFGKIGFEAPSNKDPDAWFNIEIYIDKRFKHYWTLPGYSFFLNEIREDIIKTIKAKGE
jgi:hypothetical protein